MARIAQRSGLSPHEFLTWEEDQRERHEYYRGEVFGVTAESPRHNALSSSLTTTLHL